MSRQSVSEKRSDAFTGGPGSAEEEQAIWAPPEIASSEEATIVEALRAAAASGWVNGLPDEVRREVRRAAVGKAILVAAFCYFFLILLAFFGGPFLVTGMLMGMAVLVVPRSRRPTPPNPYGLQLGYYRAEPANEKERLVLEYLRKQPLPNPIFSFCVSAIPVIIATFLGTGSSQGFLNLPMYGGEPWEKATTMILAFIFAALWSLVVAASNFWALFFIRVGADKH